jgi:hypothetical protein
MPSKKDWQEESQKDGDVKYLIDRIVAKKSVALTSLSCKAYYKDWANGQLEVEDMILYQWEMPKLTKIRQLRRRVVPLGLRQVVYTAYHAIPMAGHVGVYKTYWRIAARYYWPGMNADIKKAVTECGHCILGNNVSHQAQQILGALSFDEPFDVIAIDLWMPGVTFNKGSFIGDRTKVRNASLTSLCNLTGFASIGYVDSLEGESITRVLMAQIVLPNGIPKLVLLDADSLFKNDLVRLLDDMGLPFHVVSAEQH